MAMVEPQNGKLLMQHFEDTQFSKTKGWACHKRTLDKDGRFIIQTNQGLFFLKIKPPISKTCFLS